MGTGSRCPMMGRPWGHDGPTMGQVVTWGLRRQNLFSHHLSHYWPSQILGLLIIWMRVTSTSKHKRSNKSACWVWSWKWQENRKKSWMMKKEVEWLGCLQLPVTLVDWRLGLWLVILSKTSKDQGPSFSLQSGDSTNDSIGILYFIFGRYLFKEAKSQ